MDQEEEEQRGYPEAYYPIPKGVMKEEETSGENNVEQQMMYPVAYPPLPSGPVKEEGPFGDAQEENNGQAEQLMASSQTSNGTINKELEQSMEEHNAINLDEGQQVSLEPLVAYLPLPRGAIKEEPLEEKGDEQPQQQVIIAYPPIARGNVKEELQSNVHQDELDVVEHQLDLEPLIAYRPLPRGVIKEELLEDKVCEEQAKQLIAYLPIPRGRIKEESVDNRDDFNLEEHRLISQEGGNQNLFEESTPAPITTASADVSIADRVNGTEQRKSQRRKKIAIASTADVISQITRSDDEFARAKSTISNRTRQLKRGSTSMNKDDDEENYDRSTADRGNGAQRPKSKMRKIAASTADTQPSTESGDQSAKTTSIISSRTRPISMSQLKRSKAPMARCKMMNDDEKNDDHSTTGSDDFGGHKSDKTVSTNSSRTRSHHSKPGSASMARDNNGGTSKKRKVNDEKGTEEQHLGTEEQHQQAEHSSFIYDGDSSSSSAETSERPSDSHNKFSCKECGRGFQKKCSLRLHFLKAHTGTGHDSRPLNHFKCDKCLKTYKYKNSLVQHLLNECQVDPAFPCSKCDYKATKKSNLRRHLISTHKVDSSQLDHVSAAAALRVRPVLPFKCDTCENTFKSKDSLYFHKKRVCGVAKSFSCVNCDYRTARKHNLRKHLMIVHGVEQSQLASFGAGKVVRPQMPFKCDKCELSYNEKRYLKRHMDSHGKILSFPCNQCGYRATQKANLKRHIGTVHSAIVSSLQA